HVSLYDRRVDVAAAADRRRVAQVLGDALHGRDDISLRLPLVFTATDLGQLDGREQRAAPRAEVFGGELRRGRGLDVVVHVAGLDGVHAPVLAVILDDLRAADRLDVAHQRGQLLGN